MPNKQASAFGVYNWKKNKIDRVKQTSQGQLSPHEVEFEIEIEANVQEIDVPKISMELDIGEVDVKKAVANELVDDPETRLSDMPDASEMVFHLTEDNYEDKLDEFVEEVEDYDKAVDWLRTLIAEEHKRMNRPDVLEAMEETLRDIKQKRDGVL